MKTHRSSRTLLIIAPTLFECAKAAEAHGLTPGEIENFRNVTKAYALRGVTAGTPFIAINRRNWHATPDGYELDLALEAYQRQGRVRIAQEDDIAAHRMFDCVPMREARVV